MSAPISPPKTTSPGAWLKDFFTNPRHLLVLYLVVGLGWCLQTVLAQIFSKTPDDSTYFVFRESFYALIHHQTLYPFDPVHHHPLYLGSSQNVFKYSPTFALFFAPFALVPSSLGLALWMGVNFLAFFAAIWLLPFRSMERVLMLWVSLADLMTANRDWQSNGLVVAGIVGVFLCLQKGWPEAAACCVIAGLSIKIYGAAGGIFFLFYPRKARFLASTAIFGVVAFLLPLTVISWSELLGQYQDWLQTVQSDTGYLKRSIMGLIKVCMGWTPPRPWMELAGMLVMLLPLVRTDLYDQVSFRLRMVASVLLGVVIFNHMADRPAFATAAAGAVLWYMLSSRDIFRTVLFLLIVVFSSKRVLHPDEIKVVPFAVIWVILQWEIWRQRPDDPAPVGLKLETVTGL